MLHYTIYCIQLSLYGEDYLPLSSVYFVFPRNTSLSYCVLYERLKICGHLWGLNPGCLNTDDSQVMICDKHCTVQDLVV